MKQIKVEFVYEKALYTDAGMHFPSKWVVKNYPENSFLKFWDAADALLKQMDTKYTSIHTVLSDCEDEDEDARKLFDKVNSLIEKVLFVDGEGHKQEGYKIVENYLK